MRIIIKVAPPFSVGYSNIALNQAARTIPTAITSGIMSKNTPSNPKALIASTSTVLAKVVA